MPAIEPTSNQYAGALSGGIAALTPGSIMLLLRRRMSDMDGQIDSIMGEIESNTAASEKIQKQVEALTEIKAEMANMQTDGTQPVGLDSIVVEWEGVEMTATQLINQLDITVSTGNSLPLEGSQAEFEHQAGHHETRASRLASGEYGSGLTATARTRLEREARGAVSAFSNLAQGQSAVHGIHTLTGDSIDATIQATQTQGRRMNSGNEVLMVRMQSAMQQRSQSVTMATQMLKSINDSSNSIAQNIGR